ncbi:uncharacterized protein G2W53_041988 [Senna tora]|uniref:Uncharacterized protein n=1 Tax=Senna tora TaxID=362788 RepID=A0A834SKV0_9FABA|nr:uncharacterized protein G2W53_041988 [Senna tora]
MEWREKMMKPVRRVYFGVTTHFRIRKSGSDY